MDCDQCRILIQWIWEYHLDNRSYKDLCKPLGPVSMYETDLSDDSTEIYLGKCREYVSDVRKPSGGSHYPRSVYDKCWILQFFRAEYFNGESTRQSGSLALMRGIQQYFIDIQNRCVRATDELSRLVIETASQRPATLKDFRTEELALERQTQLWELLVSNFEPIGTRQEVIAKKFCRFRIREEGSRLTLLHRMRLDLLSHGF